jgi:formylaminopyrimidine deformylase / aminopyrimidine aminohydrolase
MASSHDDDTVGRLVEFRSVPVTELLQRHAGAWRAATGHPFLAGVRDGSVPVAAFDTWLVQDARFVADLLRFQARLLARAPRPAQAVLATGLGSLVAELDWFDGQAGARGLDLTAPALPATRAYAALLDRLDRADVGTALMALWVVERTYLDAWSQARPGAPAYREFVEHWTTPGFAGYVAGLESAADAAAAGSPADARPAREQVFLEVVAAETAFWDMALRAPGTA